MFDLKKKILEAIDSTFVWKPEDATGPVTEIFDDIVATLRRDNSIFCSPMPADGPRRTSAGSLTT
jgi:hypothetical protein